MTKAWILSTLKTQLYKIVRIKKYKISKYGISKHKIGIYRIGKYKYLSTLGKSYQCYNVGKYDVCKCHVGIKMTEI